MEKEIVNGNRIIAEFMGFESSPFKNSGGQGYSVKLIGYPEEHSIKMSCSYYGTLQENIDRVLSWENRFFYHTSWDWLMPVVEKIEGIGNYGVEISHFSCNIYELSLDQSDLNIEANFNSKIEAVWQAVIQFITWYTTTPTQ